MGVASNQRGAEQLGMPVGTAQGRLRQRLLFKLVVDAKLNNCFVCEEPIVSLETFSIEHKEPWLDENPDLFWDLDNIAFSHRSCNRPHRKYRGGYTGPKHTCGTQGGYRSGCKCEECRAWKSQDNKRWSMSEIRVTQPNPDEERSGSRLGNSSVKDERLRPKPLPGPLPKK